MFESHFQTFDETSDPAHGAARLAALRAELARRGLDGFIAPRADEHQNEYVPANAERLAWLTGFTGSAGVVIVLGDKAALFVDGRYTLQAPQQVDPAAFAVVASAETSPEAWLETNLRKGARIGCDGRLHTPGQFTRLEKAAKAAGAELVVCESNPIDAVWADRPAAPRAPIRLHPARYAGESAARKLGRIAAALSSDALLVSDPHAMAWAFNIRGGDVAHTPLPLGHALIEKSGAATLYLDPRKLDARTTAALAKLARLRAPEQLADDLRALGEAGRTLRFDAATAPMALTRAFRDAGGIDDVGVDPIAAMKARKNAVELAGARAAHLRDGVAMVRFLAWFAGEAPKGRLTEIEAARALETFRRDSGELADISFPTISAMGAQRGQPALQRHRSVQCAHRARDLSRRFRRPISRRHDRHHAHGRGRQAERRNARPFHPRADWAYRHRPRGVSQGRHGRADRRLCARAVVGGGARFRSRHGPWRRLVSVGARGAATDFKARPCRAGAGDDPVERAGLLQSQAPMESASKISLSSARARSPAANARCSDSRP
jgi:Xaa-Pro aminopeptidase